MTETALEPILLDVDMSVEEFDLTVDANSEDYDLNMDTRVEQVVIEGVQLPEGGDTGDLLAKRSSTDYDTEWITPASSAEKDNTRPITAAAVYTEIGNINALLATI